MRKDTVLKLGDARQLHIMMQGDSIPASRLDGELARELLDIRVIAASYQGSRGRYRLTNPEGLQAFLGQRYDIRIPLEEWIDFMAAGDFTRGDCVKKAGNSKGRGRRTFHGFVLKVLRPLRCRLNGSELLLNPTPGMDNFVRDYLQLELPPGTVVVGVENGETFQYIERYAHLFPAVDMVFVSRYPQSGDLVQWLQRIPNRYLHFGDFDLAGIFVYLNEFFNPLGQDRSRLSFFIPENIEEYIRNGNRELYDKQNRSGRYRTMAVTDERVIPLLEQIHHCHRVYEQEGYEKKG